MEVQCPTCSARFKVPDTVSIATCPYCGTTFHVHSGEKSEEEHFFFPLSKKDAGGVLLKFLSRQYGAPADITGAKIKKKDLHWVPVYFFYLHGRSKRWPTIEEVMFIGIPAEEKFDALLAGYPFPIRGKRFFDESVVKKGHYYEPSLSKEKAEEIAKQTLLTALRGEASQESHSLGEVETEVRYLGLVHYPIWEVHYEYGEEFTGYVDGTDGRVIRAEYPIMGGARRKATLLAGTLAGLGLIIGALSLPIVGGWGFIGAFIPGAVGALAVARKGVVKKRWVSGVFESEGGNVHFKPLG